MARRSATRGRAGAAGRWVLVAAIFAGACHGADRPAAPVTVDAATQAEFDAWRERRVAGLTRPDGWLATVGLAWVDAGVHTAGSDPGSGVVLPAPVPARLGEFAVDGAGEGGAVSFRAAPGDPRLTVATAEGGRPVAAGETLKLAPDTAPSGPTVLTLEGVTFFAIERGGRLGVRIKDAAAAPLREFAGLDFFPLDAAWRIEGRFEPAESPRTIAVPNVLGAVEQVPSPGAVAFEIAGTTHRLAAMAEGDDLFLVFGDATNGRETYGGGRFLYADRPDPNDPGRRVVLDFNRATNPPCAFTAFATCPLPPAGNKLPVAVTAGEKNYAHAAHSS